jgi:uncharacterized BrkB/YihY/UPF0761 family membrane protein
VIKREWFWNDEGLTELGAATLSILSILLFWLFIIWFFGGYGREATTHTREESEAARQKALEMLEEKKSSSR